MAISVGSVTVDVVPDAARFNERLRAALPNVPQVNVRVELDTTAALVRIQEMKVKLDELGARTPVIRVNADTADAAARLAALQAQLDRINGQTANANVNVNGASGAGSAAGGMSAMTQAALALAPALIPIAAAAAGAGAALLTLGAAGAAGAGVLAVAFSGVSNAVGLLGQQQAAQKAAGASAASSAASNAQAIVSAQRQIESAQMSLGDAQRAAANQTLQDSQAVASAQYGVAQATQRVQDAQIALVQADQQEQTALRALQDARESAARQLQSMANSAVDARLAEQQATLDLQTAQAAYTKTMGSSASTDQQKAQASLDLQKAQQHLVESQEAAKNATEDNTKAQAAGVDGSAQVIAANKGIESAQAGVTTATRTLADAQHNQQQAVQTLADAQRKTAEDQITSQESIVRAQQGVASAMDAMASAQRQAAGSTNASLAAINAQVAALDPVTRSFAEYLRGTWGPIWKDVQAAAAGGLLPGVKSMLEDIRPLMPGFVSFISDLSSRLGDMAKAAGEALKGPFWQSFFDFLSRVIGPALTTLGQITGDIIQGFAGIWMAFEPVITPVLDGLKRLADRFADFGANASSSSGFGKFIGYIQQYGPLVWKTIGDIAEVVGRLLTALAPLGPPILIIVDALAQLIEKIPINVLTGIAGAAIAVFVAMKAFQAVSAIASLGPWGIAALAVAAGFIILYTNSKTFRDFIQDKVVPTLQEWWRWIQDRVIPVLQDLWTWIKDKLVPVLVGVFMDAWNGITDAVRIVSRAFSDHKSQLGQVWDFFKAYVGFIVRDVIPLIGEGLKAAFHIVGDAMYVVIWIVGLLVDQWNWMWGVGKDLGRWFSHDFVGFFVGAWDAIRSGWSILVQDIKDLWQDIEHWVMTPVAWVVRYVINDGLIKAWDWVSDHLLGGAMHATPMDVPNVPPLARATGGYVSGPGGPTTDSIPARLSNGEFVINAAATAQHRSLLEAINGGQGAGGPGFAGGGIVGVLSDIWGGITSGAKIIADPVGYLGGLLKSAMGGIGQASPFIDMLGNMIGGIASNAGHALLNLIGLGGSSGQAGPAGGTGGSTAIPASAGAIASQVQAAAANFGWDSGPEWAALSKVINRESGWNPNAANPTSSARGLFQKMTSAHGPLEPTVAGQANWGLHYIQDRYKDPIGAWAHEMSAGWYDQGGLLQPGLQMVYNGTGRPELVAPPQTFDQVISGMARGGSGTQETAGIMVKDGGILQLQDLDEQSRVTRQATRRALARTGL